MRNKAPVHPRPQLVRDGWTDLSGPWGFAHDDDDVGLADGWHESAKPFDRTITVPYPPESKLSGIHDPGYHPVVWYRSELKVPGPPDGQRLLLHFGAVDYRATVWVDGVRVADHEGGHTPFSCDITHALRNGSKHSIVVRAEDQPTDATQPRGKQDWRVKPHSIWYHRTTGIWQPVWLEQVPETHIAEIQWTPDLPAGRVRFEVRLNRVPREPLSVVVRLRADQEVLARQNFRLDGDRAVSEVTIPALGNGQDAGRLLWSPENPRLVDAEVSLKSGDRTVDQVGSYFGLRSTGIGGGRFLLNGRPYFLRSVLEQGYWPDSHLAAPGEEALRREVELIKELGFNAVRVHQKVEDPRFLYWCDRLGLLVWGEMANAFEFGPGAVERLVREWLEVVRRDRSHPCIVTWVPLNESWGIQEVMFDPAQRSYADSLYHLTKALDPSRPVISNDGWEHTTSDIIGIHDYAPRGSHLRERYGDATGLRHTVHSSWPAKHPVVLEGFDPGDRPVMLTEFGGVRFASRLRRGWGYSQVSSEKEFAERLTELIDAVLDSTELAGFCYTQLTDTEQEQNGLLTADRKPKIPVRRIRAIMGRAARSMPVEALTHPATRDREDTDQE